MQKVYMNKKKININLIYLELFFYEVINKHILKEFEFLN